MEIINIATTSNPTQKQHQKNTIAGYTPHWGIFPFNIRTNVGMLTVQSIQSNTLTG